MSDAADGHASQQREPGAGRDDGGAPDQGDSPGNGDSPDNLEGIFDRLVERTQGEDGIAVSDVLDAFEDRLLGPALCIPSILLLTPLGGVPTMPTVVAALIGLIAVQRLFGRQRPWIPSALEERSVDRERVRSALDGARPWARRVDKLLAPRLSGLVTGAMAYVNAALVVALACLMPPLEIVPFGVMAPAGAVLLLGLALTARDGVVAIAAWVLAAVTLGVVWQTVL